MSDWLLWAAALLPAVTAFLLLHVTRWDRGDAALPLDLLVGLAVGIGLGIGSCTYFVALVAFSGARGAVVAADLALAVVALTLARSRVTLRPHRTVQHLSAIDKTLGAAVLVAALAGAVAFAAITLAGPHGEWDAWAIWNLRARWLFRAGPAWWTAFTKQTIHGDYPLLLPGTVARLWAYGGDDSPLVPAALAAAYAAALVLLLSGAVTALRGRAQGLLAALCLLGTPLFLRSAAGQYADIPLAYYMLASLALLAARDRDPSCQPTALAWAGATAGLAAWTKNEGLLLLLCLATVRGGRALARREPVRGPLAWFLLGLAPFAALILYFKLVLAPPSYLVGEQHLADLLARITDWSRYAAIVRAAGAEVARDGGLLPIVLGLYLVLLGRTGDGAARRAAASAALVLAAVSVGYGAIYLITPADLAWQLAHSLDRLVLQLWPSVLFAFFLYAASPIEVAAPESSAASHPPAVRARREARSRKTSPQRIP